jgi:hypothetical protein
MSEWNLGGVQRDLKYLESFPNNNNDELIDLEIEELQETIEYLKLLKTSATPAEREQFIKNFQKNWKKKDGGAPVHKRYRGPIYSAPSHSFGSGYVGRS